MRSCVSTVADRALTGQDWQCAAPCSQETFPLPEDHTCPKCRGKARPNVLLFEDTAWVGGAQMEAVAAFAARAKRAMAGSASLRLAIVEIGAADRVPTIRTLAEDLLAQLVASGAAFEDARAASPVPRALLIRINLDPELCGIVRDSAKHLQPLLIALPMRAQAALEQLE